MKVFWFDTETTGLDPIKNDIIQISGVVEIDGVEKETFNFKCQPFSYENISKEALEITHLTIEEIKTYESPNQIHFKLTELMGKYVEKYDKKDKYYTGGYNVQFDTKFLEKFFIKNNDNYFGSWFNGRFIDPFTVLNFMEYAKPSNLPDLKLGTVCEKLGISLDAHDALNDIKATRELAIRIKKGKNGVTE